MEDRSRRRSIFQPSNSTDNEMNRPRRLFSTQDVVDQFMDEEEERDLTEIDYDEDGSDVEEEVDLDAGDDNDDDDSSVPVHSPVQFQPAHPQAEIHLNHQSHAAIDDDLSANWGPAPSRRGAQPPVFSERTGLKDLPAGLGADSSALDCLDLFLGMLSPSKYSFLHKSKYYLFSFIYV